MVCALDVKTLMKIDWLLLVWSGGMDSKVYEWDFSRGVPTNIYDMSKPMSTHTHIYTYTSLDYSPYYRS